MTFQSAPTVSGYDQADFALAQDGFCILKDAMPQHAISALATDLDPLFEVTPFCTGDFYGERTKRFGSLLKRSPRAADLAMHSLILRLADRVLLPWCDCIQLNLMQAISLHPGAPAQFPHRDQDMWRGIKGEVEYLVNVMWPLTSFTEANGATLLYPDSHGGKAIEQGDPGAPLVAECEPGDAIIFLGSTLHGAGWNRSLQERRAVVVSYSLGWLKPYENQWLVYPPAVARHFAPDVAALLEPAAAGTGGAA